MIKDFQFENLFAVPLLKTIVDLPHKEISDYLRIEFSLWKRSYTSYYDSEFNDRLKKNLPHREKLENAMSLAGHTFVKSRGYECDKKLDYWFSIYQTGDDHNIHTHPKSIVAGTYYPHADKTSTKIRYHNPARVVTMHGETPIDGKYVMHDHYPTTGEMNLWPAWLEHEVRPQKPVDPSEARIAISFNYGRS